MKSCALSLTVYHYTLPCVRCKKKNKIKKDRFHLMKNHPSCYYIDRESKKKMFSIIISSFLLHTFPPLNTKRSNINRNANVKAIHYRSEDIRVDSQRSSPRADSLSRLIREFDSSVRKKHKNGSV